MYDCAMQTVTFTYETLAEYFEEQKNGTDKPTGNRFGDAERDTHESMAARLNVKPHTIYRIAAGIANPSFQLARAIWKDVDVNPMGMGKPEKPVTKKRKKRGGK